MGDELKADVLIDLEENLRERLLESFSSKEIVEDVIDNLDSDDAADVIQEFSKEIHLEIYAGVSGK